MISYQQGAVLKSLRPAVFMLPELKTSQGSQKCLMVCSICFRVSSTVFMYDNSLVLYCRQAFERFMIVSIVCCLCACALMNKCPFPAVGVVGKQESVML